MRSIFLGFVWVFASAGMLLAADPSVIVQAERNFSKLAVEKGVKTAFLQYLADDSIVFHGGPVNGKKYYEARPDSPGILYWQPQVVEISSAGDFGYSTGPWEFRNASMQEKPVAYGTFASIWKKQPDGSFKVVLDLGCGYPNSTVAVSSLENATFEPAAPGLAARDVEVDKVEEELMRKDREFSDISQRKERLPRMKPSPRRTFACCVTESNRSREKAKSAPCFRLRINSPGSRWTQAFPPPVNWATRTELRILRAPLQSRALTFMSGNTNRMEIGE